MGKSGAESFTVFFRSSKLAIVLLLLLSILSVGGTFFPSDKMEPFLRGVLGPWSLPPARVVGLIDTYHSPLFVNLAAILCLNIVFCTWHRFAVRRTASARLRRRVWMDLLMHFSILVILAGGVIKGLWGFIGTQHLFVGVETGSVYDWRAKKEAPLGFTVLLEEIVNDYYPVRIRVGLKDRESGEKIGLVEIMDGESAGLPGTDLKLELRGFDASRGRVSLIASGGGSREEFLFAVSGEDRKDALFGPYSLTLVAFKRVLKKVRGRIVVIDGGNRVREQWFSVNSRIAYGGMSIFQTAWGKDKYENPFIGIQVSRDPGAPVFWSGCVLFSLVLPLFLFSRRPKKGRRNQREDGS